MENQNAATVIGPGTEITGEVKSKGTLRIEGRVNGRIESEDTIVIHQSGVVSADLDAKQVVISGTVEGNTFAHERLEVTESGKILGNITAPRLSIAEGVVFEGTCTMKTPAQAKASEKPQASNSKAESNGAKQAAKPEKIAAAS